MSTRKIYYYTIPPVAGEIYKMMNTWDLLQPMLISGWDRVELWKCEG